MEVLYKLQRGYGADPIFKRGAAKAVRPPGITLSGFGRCCVSLNDAASSRRPLGVTIIGLIFFFGVFMSALAAISLLNPGSVLDLMWRINPHARDAFVQLGSWAPRLLAVVCISCVAASFGFITGRRWGYRLGVAMLTVNLAGDLVNGLTGMEPHAWAGVPIAGSLLWYLSSGKVKAFFGIMPS